MKLLDVAEIKIERIDFTTMKQHPWRPHEMDPSCVSVTRLLRDIAVDSGKWSKEEESDVMPLRMLTGMGMEAILAQLYPDMTWQPGRLSFEGIEGHPDGLSTIEHESVDGPFYVNEEFKYTATSLREKGGKPDQFKDIRSNWMYNCQQMAYLKLWSEALGVPVLHGRFHVVYGMGNYEKYTLDERYFRYLIEYEQGEVDRNWTMLEKQRDSQWARS